MKTDSKYGKVRRSSAFLKIDEDIIESTKLLSCFKLYESNRRATMS